jgi:hypothetical protein
LVGHWYQRIGPLVGSTDCHLCLPLNPARHRGSGDHKADLHLAPDPQPARLRQLEGPRGAGGGVPATTSQACIDLIRNRPDYASRKDRKALAAALRPIYAAPSAEAAEAAGAHRQVAMNQFAILWFRPNASPARRDRAAL